MSFDGLGLPVTQTRNAPVPQLGGFPGQMGGMPGQMGGMPGQMGQMGGYGGAPMGGMGAMGGMQMGGYPGQMGMGMGAPMGGMGMRPPAGNQFAGLGFGAPGQPNQPPASHNVFF